VFSPTILAASVRLTAAAWPSARGGFLLLVLLLEIAVIDRNYSFRAINDADGIWIAFNSALKIGGYVSAFGGVAFAMLSLARDSALIRAWFSLVRDYAWGRWFVAQLVLFAALLAAQPILVQPAQTPPWPVFLLWLAAGGAMIVCALLALAPLTFWRRLLNCSPLYYAAAAAVGAVAYATLDLAQNSWNALSSATLHVALAILRIIEPDAHVDAPRQVLGAGDFEVAIRAACSGYEGIGLVLTMMSVFLVAFRRDLRFPHALWLLPLGAAAIWLMNAVRIALLVSIGHRWSPDVALNGFHSQAGWAMFLAATIGLMAIAYASPMFRKGPKASVAQDPALALAVAMLAPFIALMAARIGAAVFGEQAFWISVLVIALPTVAILHWRKQIRTLLGKLGAEPILIGLAVGALWIVTEPTANDGGLGAWLASREPAEALAWLAVRIFGFALIVPIAEELVFRGYLHRALVAKRFEDAAPAAFGWSALIVTSLLFGFMHGRWLAGALAGAAFAVTLYRSKSLTGPISAHVAANGLIAAYAIATGSWEML
jgi:exosortase E/protease (VPEID-CTERM system)